MDRTCGALMPAPWMAFGMSFTSCTHQHTVRYAVEAGNRKESWGFRRRDARRTRPLPSTSSIAYARRTRCSSKCISYPRWFVDALKGMAFALRFLIGMALLCGGSVPVMAFVDPLAIPAPRGGSASRTPLPAMQYRLRGGMQAFAAGEGGDSIPERLAAVQAKIKHAGQPNGARDMPRRAFTCLCECFLCTCNCIDLVLV